MRKLQTLGVMLALASANSFAGFEGATFDDPGGHQESFAHLVANGRSSGDEHLLKPLPIPYVGSMTASFAPVGDVTASYAHQDLNLLSNRLALDITDFNHRGKASVGSDGAWLFTVSELTATVASGALHVSAETTNQITVNSTFWDLTASTMLYESYQFDSALNGDYAIGEIANPLYGSFVGSLNNTLVPGHVYRLTYAFFTDGPDSGSGMSASTGQLVLAAVPEPSASLLALAALGLLGLVARRHRS